MTIPQIIIVSFAVGVLAFLVAVLNALWKHEPELSRLQAQPLPFSEQSEPLLFTWDDVLLEAELALKARWEMEES